MNIEHFFHTTFILWVVMDPLGNIPIFVSVLKDFSPEEQKRIIIREMFIALFVMIILLLGGAAFFDLLGVGTATLEIAGGTILFLIGVPMIFSTPKAAKLPSVKKDPLIVPLAVPCIAGPGVLAMISLLGGSDDTSWLESFLAVFTAWLLLVPFLYASSYIKKLFSENGLVAIEQLFGYLIILVSVEMALSGVGHTFL